MFITAWKCRICILLSGGSLAKRLGTADPDQTSHGISTLSISTTATATTTTAPKVAIYLKVAEGKIFLKNEFKRLNQLLLLPEY